MPRIHAHPTTDPVRPARGPSGRIARAQSVSISRSERRVDSASPCVRASVCAFFLLSIEEYRGVRVLSYGRLRSRGLEATTHRHLA